jgi:hypothetical protein
MAFWQSLYTDPGLVLLLYEFAFFFLCWFLYQIWLGFKEKGIIRPISADYEEHWLKTFVAVMIGAFFGIIFCFGWSFLLTGYFF